jgi:hypothetical protein
MVRILGSTGSRRRRTWLALGTVAALTLLAIPGTSFANLAGSTFEGNDGNLVVDTAGNTDWQNAPNRVVGLDQPSGSTDNSFGQGTKEDNANTTVVTGSIPPNKNDLTRFYVGSEFVGGSNFLYLAWERAVNIGNANLDLELSQNATTGFTGTTTGPVTLNRTAGDILITYDFSGSGTPTLGLLKWVTSGPTSQCFSSNSLPCWGNRVNLSAAGSAEGAVNTGTVTDPVPPNAPRSLTTGLFGEAAVNLTAAGVFPPGTCEAFGSTFLKSRASSAFGAEVKDFIAPQPVNISNCGTIVVKKVTDPSPDPTNTSFSFTLTGGPSNLNKSFSLKNGETNTTSNLLVGSGYAAAETVPANWELVSATCDDGSPVTNISVSPNEIVTCTFTDRLLVGAIRVTKQSSKDNSGLAGAQFVVKDSGNNTVATLTSGADGTACTDNLSFGNYTVTETAAPSGYAIDNPSPVSVAVDHVASCTSGTPNAPAAFTDTPLSRITVSFESLAPGNPTSATVQCTGEGSPSPLPEGTPKVLDNLAPGTYSCTVVIDP